MFLSPGHGKRAKNLAGASATASYVSTVLHRLTEPTGSQAGRAPQGTPGKHVLVPTALTATWEEDAHLGNG